jgi:hypothetical protein
VRPRARGDVGRAVKRERRVTTPGRAGQRLIGDLVEDVRLLKSNTVQLDDEGRLLLGPMYLYAVQNADDTVTVYLQNAITNGQPVTLGKLA